MIIVADDRERSSGVIDLLKKDGIDVIVRRLPCCDYIINREIGVERKTDRDFLISIMDGRLFRQSQAMKRKLPRPVFLIEGNPFKVDMNFSGKAIRGAIISLQVVWCIPVLFSRSKEETCQIFRFIGEQDHRNTDLIKLRHGYRPKKLITRQLHMLQGFPRIGPSMAKRMLEHFGSVRKVMTADRNALLEVDGIGARMADTICAILDKSQNHSQSTETLIEKKRFV
jgi:Fanconi anemia group M protein